MPFPPESLSKGVGHKDKLDLRNLVLHLAPITDLEPFSLWSSHNLANILLPKLSQTGRYSQDESTPKPVNMPHGPL
jgi:hypothetical protein